jgi:hypothetical protein
VVIVVMMVVVVMMMAGADHLGTFFSVDSPFDLQVLDRNA